MSFRTQKCFFFVHSSYMHLLYVSAPLLLRCDIKSEEHVSNLVQIHTSQLKHKKGLRRRLNTCSLLILMHCFKIQWLSFWSCFFGASFGLFDATDPNFDVLVSSVRILLEYRENNRGLSFCLSTRVVQTGLNVKLGAEASEKIKGEKERWRIMILSMEKHALSDLIIPDKGIEIFRTERQITTKNLCRGG